MFKSGFVSLIGRPNAGKSTLVNACMGEHVSIVSNVAQTTRRSFRAVINREDAQIVLVDTPGLHKPKDALGGELNKSALAALSDVDVICMLIDGTKSVGAGDAWVASHVDAAKVPKILVITKADLLNQDAISAQIDAASKLAHFDDVLVISAEENFNVDSFLHKVLNYLPEGPMWFPLDMPFDASDEEIVAEFIREKILKTTRDEVPHSVGVMVREIDWRNNSTAYIDAVIYVERESQKAIIIGKGGSAIKQVGKEARANIEKILGAKVFLDLKVQVKKSWRSDESIVERLGYAYKD